MDLADGADEEGVEVSAVCCEQMGAGGPVGIRFCPWCGSSLTPNECPPSPPAPKDVFEFKKDGCCGYSLVFNWSSGFGFEEPLAKEVLCIPRRPDVEDLKEVADVLNQLWERTWEPPQ